MSTADLSERLLEAAPCALSLHDLRGVFLHASLAARAVFGADPAALVGRALRDLVVPEDAAALDAQLAEAAFADAPVTATRRLPAEGGGARWVEIAARSVRDRQSGEPVEIACAFRDVTADEAAKEEHARVLAHAQQLGARLDELVASVPGIVWESWIEQDPLHARVNFVSRQVEEMTGYTPEEWHGTAMFWLDIMHPDDKERVLAESRASFERGHGVVSGRYITKSGKAIWVETHQRLMRSAEGAPIGVRGVTLDISARKEAEAQQARLQQEIIETQARLLAELSTPLIPIGDEIMVMPLVGTLDAKRAERVLQALLEGMSAAGAKVAILDVTGVPKLDAESANALVRAARGVQLLGAQVVLTGIRPEVAQTLVTLEVDLQGIATQGTLQAGIRYAMAPR